MPKNRPDQPPPRPGTLRQAGVLSPPVVPDVVFAGGGTVDKRVIIPVVGKLTPGVVDRIRVWRLKNPASTGYNVEVWYDPDSLLYLSRNYGTAINYNSTIVLL